MAIFDNDTSPMDPFALPLRQKSGESTTTHHPHHTHHFHFPPVGLSTMIQRAKSHSHHPHHPSAKAKLGISKSVSHWGPDTDIRETMLAYHIEIEVPGVADKETLLIQWMSPRTLLVEGTIPAPSIGHFHPAEGDSQWEQENEGWSYEAKHPQKDSNPPDGGSLTRTDSIEEDTKNIDVPHLLLSERKIGSWRRTFTLPVDVDMKGLRARLEAGLLRIDLPKRDLTGEPAVKVEIQG